MTRIKNKPALSIKAVALFCATLVFVLGLMAVSPDLHHQVHQDCNEQNHSCAATLFAQGTDAFIPFICVYFSNDYSSGVILKTECIVIALCPYTLQPERGPPIII